MNAPSPRTRRIGAGIVGLAVSVVAVVVLVAVIDVEETAAALGRTDLRWVALTILMVPAQILLRSWRWALLLPRRADGRRPSSWRVLPPMLTGYFANLVLPARLGEPVRGYLVARRERLGLSRVLGSILLERVIDLATLAFVGVGAAIVVGAPGWVTRGTIVVAVIGVLLAAILAASGIARVARTIGRVVGARVARFRRVFELVESFGEGAGGDGRLALGGALVLSTVTWAFVAATYWLLGRALGLELEPAQAVLVAAIATLGTAIPSAPAYIGTFEVAATGAAMAVGIGAEQALALALLAHAITTVPFAIAGGAAVASMSLSLDEVAEEAITAAGWTGTAREAEPTA
jgi:glycosyltransferase 2 family protein